MRASSSSPIPQPSAASIQARKPIPVVATTMSGGCSMQLWVTLRRASSSSTWTISIAGPYITVAPRRCRAAPNSLRRLAAVRPTENPASGPTSGMICAAFNAQSPSGCWNGDRSFPSFHSDSLWSPLRFRCVNCAIQLARGISRSLPGTRRSFQSDDPAVNARCPRPHDQSVPAVRGTERVGNRGDMAPFSTAATVVVEGPQQFPPGRTSIP